MLKLKGRIVVILCVIGGCSVEEARKPTPPDLTALVEGYANPTRNFDEQAAIEVQSLVESKVTALFDLATMSDRINAALAALGGDEMSFAPGTTQDLVLQGQGFARITRICAGHGTPPPPVDKAVNGYLDLTAGYTLDGLDSVIFGDAVNCLEQADTTQVVINGAVALYVGDNIKIEKLPQNPIIFQLAEFNFSVDGVELVAGEFDFQVCRGTTTACVPGTFEILIGLASGSTLIFFIDLTTETGGFRGANGVFQCDFVAGTCTDGAGGVVATPGYQL